MARRGPITHLRPAALLVLVVLGGCDGADEEEKTTASTTTTTAEEPARAEPAPRPAAVYFTAGEQFAERERSLGPKSRAAELVEELLAGPTPRERRAGVRTQIPAGVELERIEVAGHTATVELSAGFTAGIPASARARSDTEQQDLNARIGQLTYTLTQLPHVRAVEVRTGGTRVEPALRRAAFAKPAGGPQPVARPKGLESARALEVQARLAELRFLPRGAVDGVYGYRTQQAVIAFQAWNGLTRDGVVGPQTTAALRTAKRPKPGAGGPQRRIEVYRDKGVALLVSHGATKRAIHVSTGAPGTPTPAGTYEVFRKELRSWSVPFQVWLPYASYFNNGIAFHEYADVPPFPASHGCVRVPVPEAKGVYRFAAVGTTVVVR